MHEVGVADVGVAVSVGEPGGLQVLEQRLDARLRAQREAVEDVEDLALGRPAAGRRRHPVDVQSPVVHVGRREDPRAVGPQIVQRHDPRIGDHGLSGREHRVVVGLHHRLADRPVIERRRALTGDQLVRARQVRIAQPRPHGQRIAGRSEQERPARRVRLQRGQAGLLELVEVEVDREPSPGDADRRSQVRGEREPAEVPRGRGPRRDIGRHAGGQRLIGGRRVAHRLAGGRVHEHARRARRGAGLATVDGRHGVGTRVVDDHEATAARAGHPRNGHPEGAGGGDGGVDGIAAAPEHIDPGRAGAHVHRGDGAAGAGGDRRVRVAGVAPRGGRGGRQRGADGGADHCGKTGDCSTAHQHPPPVDRRQT